VRRREEEEKYRRRALPKFKFQPKNSLAHVHLVRHRAFFIFILQKNLYFTVTFYSFGICWLCKFSPGHFDILFIFSSSYATKNSVWRFHYAILQKNRNSCLLILNKTKWHNSWAPLRILFLKILSIFLSIILGSKKILDLLYTFCDTYFYVRHRKMNVCGSYAHINICAMACYYQVCPPTQKFVAHMPLYSR
jgi:hypothetical protein